MDTKFFDIPNNNYLDRTIGQHIKLTITEKPNEEAMKKIDMINRKLDKLLRMQKQKPKQTKNDGYEVV